MQTLNTESPLNPLDAYSQHPSIIKQISHIHEKDIVWKKYFGLIHTFHSCSLVTCHLQEKRSGPTDTGLRWILTC